MIDSCAVKPICSNPALPTCGLSTPQVSLRLPLNICEKSVQFKVTLTRRITLCSWCWEGLNCRTTTTFLQANIQEQRTAMCWWYIVRQLPAHCTHLFRATSALYCFSSCYYEKFCEDVEIHLPTLAYLYLTLLNSSFKNIRFDFTIKSLAVLFLSLVLCVRDP